MRFMMKKLIIILLSLSTLLSLGCSRKKLDVKKETNLDEETFVDKKDDVKENTIKNDQNQKDTSNLEITKEEIKDKYKNKSPTEWGEYIEGVISSIETDEKIIALTFDACGGEYGSEYDKELIDFLIREEIPSTLFINGRWIDSNLEIFMDLAENPLFEIENHGYSHKPLSVNGNSIYGIKGTEDITEVIDEIILNNAKIKELTGKKPKYFRSGTAYYDDIAVKIARDLSVIPVNFNIIGDAGATFSEVEIKNALLSAKEGSIVILHMNKPSKSTAEGVKLAVPILKEKGFKFVKLEDYDDKLR